jgi:hypothetical protein
MDAMPHPCRLGMIELPGWLVNREPLALPAGRQRRMRVACCAGSTGETAMT